MTAKRLFNTILATIALTTLASCEIETSDNGDFDGFWHLERVDTLATGGTLDLSKKRVFWGVQYKLISVYDIDKEGTFGYYLRFKQTHDKIVTHTPYKNNWHQDVENGGDHPIDDPTQLAPYGINNLEEEFVKEKLDGGQMILRSKTLRLKFKRF
ncbi:lipocalin-like domain-containing protein [Leyella stercorea]|uniref:lipocalin-like domain-containing protein n=1 Tax=Leyella stercorea TaxID=363265 RepID=UPI00242E71FA|nr:lipocalin-like domain-containing protein [Leyella stercorea]